MTVERFRDSDRAPVHRRLGDAGRPPPEGLEYRDSRVEPNFARGFQTMRGAGPRLFQPWITPWRGSGAIFQIAPAAPSRETRETVAPCLDAPPKDSRRDCAAAKS